MAKPIDEKEIARLLDKYSGPLSLFVARWSRSPEDCVQEAFVALAGQIPPPQNKVAWLFRVARNKALNESRQRQRRTKRERSTATQSNFLESTHRIETEEQETELLVNLEKLESKQRELIVLRIWSDLTWAEIGKLTGQSSSSAQRKYAVALEALKKRLETECLTKPN